MITCSNQNYHNYDVISGSDSGSYRRSNNSFSTSCCISSI